jgi:hypothetical protein
MTRAQRAYHQIQCLRQAFLELVEALRSFVEDIYEWRRAKQ